MSQATSNGDDGDGRSLKEVCEDIAANDSHSERMREIAAEIRDGIREGDIDAT